jgi:hypothetical protein
MSRELECLEPAMQGGKDAVTFEATVRRAYARLTREELPKAAEARGWPIRTSDDFERLLLDHLHDAPGEPRPEPCLVDLVLAIELGERLLAGNLCCHRMTHHHRNGHPCGKERQREALAAFIAAVGAQRRRKAG